MKVYCKRTCFERNDNVFPINGKEYGQDFVKWGWGKIYECHEPKDYEKPATYLIIESEVIFEEITSPNKKSWYPISEKNFHKYFETLDENRNKKIEQILK